MKTNLKKLRKHLHYSEDFKKEIVSLFERGKFSVLQLEKIYGMTDSTIYNWIYKYSTFNEKGFRVIEMKQSSAKKLEELSNKVKSLEQIIGQKQITIDFLEKMIEIAEEEFSISIKKKSNTSQSIGLEKIKKK